MKFFSAIIKIRVFLKKKNNNKKIPRDRYYHYRVWVNFPTFYFVRFMWADRQLLTQLEVFLFQCHIYYPLYPLFFNDYNKESFLLMNPFSLFSYPFSFPLSFLALIVVPPLRSHPTRGETSLPKPSYILTSSSQVSDSIPRTILSCSRYLGFLPGSFLFVSDWVDCLWNISKSELLGFGAARSYWLVYLLHACSISLSWRWLLFWICRGNNRRIYVRQSN